MEGENANKVERKEAEVEEEVEVEVVATVVRGSRNRAGGGPALTDYGLASRRQPAWWGAPGVVVLFPSRLLHSFSFPRLPALPCSVSLCSAPFCFVLSLAHSSSTFLPVFLPMIFPFTEHSPSCPYYRSRIRDCQKSDDQGQGMVEQRYKKGWGNRREEREKEISFQKSNTE